MRTVAGKERALQTSLPRDCSQTAAFLRRFNVSAFSSREIVSFRLIVRHRFLLPLSRPSFVSSCCLSFSVFVTKDNVSARIVRPWIPIKDRRVISKGDAMSIESLNTNYIQLCNCTGFNYNGAAALLTWKEGPFGRIQVSCVIDQRNRWKAGDFNAPRDARLRIVLRLVSKLLDSTHT